MDSGKARLDRGLILVAILCIALAAWSLRPVNYLASGSQEKSFEVACSFDRFRQIMVRKNATAAIIAHSGMTLLDDWGFADHA